MGGLFLIYEWANINSNQLPVPVVRGPTAITLVPA